jgi:hypothetical protein
MTLCNPCASCLASIHFIWRAKAEASRWWQTMRPRLRWLSYTVAPGAALIGECVAGSPQVILDTAFGGQRALDELGDDPLPRIC